MNFPANRGGLVYIGIPEPRKCENPGGDMESREGIPSHSRKKNRVEHVKLGNIGYCMFVTFTSLCGTFVTGQVVCVVRALCTKIY